MEEYETLFEYTESELAAIQQDAKNVNAWIAQHADPAWSEMLKLIPEQVQKSKQFHSSQMLGVVSGAHITPVQQTAMRSWEAAVRRVAFRKYPVKLGGKDVYFDTIYWQPYSGKANKNKGKATMSRMGYIHRVQKSNKYTKASFAKGQLVSPFEINQGRFGYCYIYSAMMAAARLTLFKAPGDSATGMLGPEHS